MGDYRTRPIRVEAVEWRGKMQGYYLPNWFIGALESGYGQRTYGKMQLVGENLQVTTDKGSVVAKPGD